MPVATIPFLQTNVSGMARTFANSGNSASPKRNSALHSSSVTRVKSKRSCDQWGKDGFFLFTVSKSIENSTSSMTSSMNINARASCVVCLLNISTTDKMLPLRTHNKYWNIFVASWRWRRLCLQQLSPRPPARKSRTCTRSRSRIWRSSMAEIVPAMQLAAHAKSSALNGRLYGVKSKFFRLDGLLLFCIIMGLALRAPLLHQQGPHISWEDEVMTESN